jgi:hypothetical protein
MSNALTSYLTESIAKAARTRTSWNDRLAHWERPASDSEEARIERAAGMVRSTLAGSAWWTSEGITIQPQGSYHNNTNVRQEADMGVTTRAVPRFTLSWTNREYRTCERILAHRGQGGHSRRT